MKVEQSHLFSPIRINVYLSLSFHVTTGTSLCACLHLIWPIGLFCVRVFKAFCAFVRLSLEFTERFFVLVSLPHFHLSFKVFNCCNYLIYLYHYTIISAKSWFVPRVYVSDVQSGVWRPLCCPSTQIIISFYLFFSLALCVTHKSFLSIDTRTKFYFWIQYWI